MNKKYPKEEVIKALSWADYYSDNHEYLAILASEVRQLRSELAILKAEILFKSKCN